MHKTYMPQVDRTLLTEKLSEILGLYPGKNTEELKRIIHSDESFRRFTKSHINSVLYHTSLFVMDKKGTFPTWSLSGFDKPKHEPVISITNPVGKEDHSVSDFTPCKISIPKEEDLVECDQLDYKGALQAELVYMPVVNYAVQQNRIPVIKKLVLQNLSEEDFSGLVLRIRSIPEFANPWEQPLEFLPRQERIEITNTSLVLSAEYLSGLTERLAGDIVVEVLKDEVVLISNRYTIDVLAFDQWNGISVLPEILAAFITPNNPGIPRILVKASEILKEWTGNPSFDAYLSRSPDRVRKQMGAIFEAIASLKVVYSLPPASFETQGQRVRMGDAVLSSGLGTCLDMALLYAGCLEAAGIHALIVVIDGHAFAGAWLVDDTFSNVVNDDVSLLKKRTAAGINEIALVEATFMNSGKDASFDQAVNHANYHLVKEDDFLLFVDVKRARLSYIKPLPQRIMTSAGWEIEQEEHEVTSRKNIIPEEIIHSPDGELTTASTFTRQKLWERKLLDLSLRNNLLNLRVSQSTIQLCPFNLSTFEDALAGGDEFQLVTRPPELINPHRNAGVYQALNLSDPVVELLKHEISRKRLCTYLTESELKNGLTKLYRSSRLSLEENGANTLYLALGFLKWYETARSEVARYAPILLLPIEIVRKSAQIGYCIRGMEEETLINITLLEMLKQDFGIVIEGLEELPRDESGVDVLKIFNVIRRGIMSQPRWDLEEHAIVGIFSFSKFIMWNDIHNNSEKLTENKVVKSLVSGKTEWQHDMPSHEVGLDEKYLPFEISLPINADATQLEAICAASEDQSFILHGPPGTGKSQTITNIIANALYQGKRVLFVAEKMAALSVVQSRLAAIGLDAFCLELHSNKAKKSAILEQLQKTTEVVRKSSPEEFQHAARRLHEQRAELNDYVGALHKQYPSGYSLFDAFAGYASIEEASDEVVFPMEFIEQLTKERMEAFDDIARELESAGSLCVHPHNHTLREIKTLHYNPQHKSMAQDVLSQLIDVLEKQQAAIKGVLSGLCIELEIMSKEQVEVLEELVGILVDLPDTPGSLLKGDQSVRSLEKIVKLCGHGTERDVFRQKLLDDYSPGILSVDGEQKLNEWKVASQTWFLPKWIGQQKILKVLKGFSLKGKAGKNKVESCLDDLIHYQKHQQVIDGEQAFLAEALGYLWEDKESNWQVVIEICNASIRITRLLTLFFNSAARAKEVRDGLAAEFSEGKALFMETKGKGFMTFLDLVKEQHELEEKIAGLLVIDFALKEDEGTDHIAFMKNKAAIWLEHLDLLRDWASWNRAKEKASEAGLLPLVLAYESGSLENKMVATSFRKSLYKQLAEFIIGNDNRLADFNGKLFEAKIQKFREQTKYFEELTKAELFARLSSGVPSFSRDASLSSENGILQRAIRSKGRGMTIRRLFDSIPNLLQKMCPCMLMSPLSVAQYFEADSSTFDIVVFDEASQMPTCEAVGAMARAKNVIVVGDPKQMPPTSFFSSVHFDEENADKEDMESILDDCLALQMPSRHLLWHYRSKHESLIAFSNSSFYDNKLLTFPSPDDLTSKVTNVFVPGYYDRGKTKQNASEARAIVGEIRRRLSDPVLSARSIGVVTFSSVQQQLIEDLLNEMFVQNPGIEAAALECQEPLFVKNIENVQGDERDIILFSVGYGPDKEGRVFLNFGPLNREGGWRRLNVAVSRARYEMTVFSTLRSDQIDISRTSAEGVAAVKAFLEYSEKGKSVLAVRNTQQKQNQQFFEQLVADQISKKGYSVHTNIGCSGFRVEIGVVHPEKPSEYILGILTDGTNYRSAQIASDREVIRESVLKMLGWQVCRLWSPDWWDNPERAVAGIAKKIEALLNESKANGGVKQAPALVPDLSFQITQEEIRQVDNFHVYKTCVLEQKILRNNDDFFEYHFKAAISNQVNQILLAEAPISHSLLSRRVLNAWGITRLGSRLDRHMGQIYKTMQLKKTTQNGSVFYWHEAQDPDTFANFRIPGEKRNPEDIPKEEIACGIQHILLNQVSLPPEDLSREVARLFGFLRSGNNVDSMMKTGIDYALSKEIIVDKNDRLILA